MAAARRKPRSQARRDKDTRRVPVWIWLLAGVLIGLIAAAALLLHERGNQAIGPQANPAAKAPRESDQGVVPPPPVDAKPTAKTEPKKPRYDFYYLLQEKEVAVPDKELAERAKAEAKQSAPAASGERFMLQAGAFRDLREADAVKARIALAGLKARVETGEVNGSPIYRVRVGPYSSARELELAKKQLAENGVPETVAVREKRE
jgi:cell division protein FtsN